ncbi:MAG: 23S rRNA (adenine(2503)-C(2))-methyltransferase RlmN [Alphaproteobacteria bacterium]|nr:23S rRNA (adenine(2503)-C(2))-methyltransferase RlmN [Alphaproteobacteria bacterium]
MKQESNIKESINTKESIYGLSVESLKEVLTGFEEPNYRAPQIYDWLWKKRVRQFSDMLNIPKNLREKLEHKFQLAALDINTQQESVDGTSKVRFKTTDSYFIEGVLIPTEHRRTACVSSQVGCSLTCSFCATGKLGRKRNLTAYEILEQVNVLNSLSLEKNNQPLSNIVFMGMGEPLLNYNQVLKSIHFITDPLYLGMSPKRITLSTAGISKQIIELGKDKVRFNLALSLHAANDKKRSEIMPINQSNNLESLKEALNFFYKQTENDISFEYILFKDFNDQEQDAKELIKLYRQIPIGLVNLIEYNNIGDRKFIKPDEKTTERFIDILQKARVNVRVRKSRGLDIDAACGQLANKN